jgi:anti-sigma regulatory factor (Ser/Thr protein kinase)
MTDERAEVSAECTILLDQDGLEHFHTFLEDFWVRARAHVGTNPEWGFTFGLMLGELLANSAEHAYARTAAEDRWLGVRLETDAGCVRAEVRDSGQGFDDANQRLDTVELEALSLTDESGRGLRILASLADDVAYQRTASGQNVWRIRKCIPAASGQDSETAV